MDENKKELLENTEEVIEETAQATEQTEEPIEVTEQAEESAEAVEETKKIAPPEEEVAESVASKPAEKKKSTRIIIIITAVILAAAVAIGAGIAIHRSRADKTVSTTAGNQAHSESAEVITGEDATKEAKVTNADAIDVITSYSDEALGVKKADYSFMIAQQAYRIEKEKYVQVIAAEKKENGDGTFSITPVAKYYISFDGETVLKENMEQPGTYEELKK